MTVLKVIKVTGSSLEPEYREGDFVIISRIPFFFRSPRVGDVVVFTKPPYGTLIKAIVQVEEQRRQVSVQGARPDSVDSRSFGPLSYAAIRGKVIWHICTR